MGRFAFLVAVVALVSPGGAESSTRILALGDFGVGGATERAMGAAVREYEERRPAAVFVTLGDNDYTESPSLFNRNWRRSFGWLGAAGVGVAGTLGNHDVRVQGGRYQFDELDMPRGYYRRRVGNIDLFLLNSNRIGRTQTAWLRKRLADSTARWKVAAFHHPAFSCGAYRSHPGVVARWVPLFERFDVDLVLSGHDHNYQRFAARRGVRYVVHGGGGAGLYPLERCPAGYPRRVAARSARGFLSIVAREDSLRVLALSPAGRLVDRLTVTG